VDSPCARCNQLIGSVLFALLPIVMLGLSLLNICQIEKIR
jgi:hypothetical protein